jgi:hypothetical protein
MRDEKKRTKEMKSQDKERPMKHTFEQIDKPKGHHQKGMI